jgi:methylisocitrate lyase
MPTLAALMKGDEPVVAPAALSPLMAMLAKQVGFKALYLSGGSLGYVKGVTEANLNTTEMAQLGLDIRSVCDLPLILDGAGGWGDPMHMHRTIRLAEGAGFAGIEIEDQLLPKRAHHHIGIDHLIPMELMVEKVREAVAVRENPDFQIIARTNASRDFGIDEALRRAEAYKKAGADVLFVATGKQEHLRQVAERAEGPLMAMTWSPQILSYAEFRALGYKLIVDPVTPLLAEYVALRQAYEAMYQESEVLPVMAAGGGPAIHKAMHETINLEALLAVERRTVERA